MVHRKLVRMLARFASQGALAALVSASAITPALAIQPMPPRAPVWVDPASGEAEVVAQLAVSPDDDAAWPAHMPPLASIPPMPMPVSDGRREVPGRTITGGSLLHDARTGITEPASSYFTASGRSGDRSPEANYTGIDVAIGAGESGRALPKGFGTMVTAGDLAGWPRRGNVRLAMRFTTTTGTTVWYVCSGSMADAAVVQTAAHCVYARNPDGNLIFDWADEIFVFPAWDGVDADSDGVVRHYGMARGTFYLAGTAYIDSGSFDADAGLVRIDRNGSRSVGMLTGWFGWAWGFDCTTIMAREYHNFSYPAEACGGGLHTGRTMYYWYGDFDSCPGNQLQLTTTAGCLTAGWGGMSGSGAYYFSGNDRLVHAVSSNSNRSTDARYARLWEQFVNDRNAFVTTTRGNVLDVEALAFRTGTVQGPAGVAWNGQGTVLIANPTNHDPPARNYTLRVYLSSNSTISASDTLLATWTYTHDLPAMGVATFNVPHPVIPTATTAGRWWLGVIVDPGTDGNVANNVTSAWDAQPVTVLPATIFRSGFE